MAITIMQRWLFKRGSADPGVTQLSPRLMNVGQVREALVTSALLQLPFSMPKHEKMDRVDGIITELVRAGWQGSGLYPGMSAQTPCRCTACMSARTTVSCDCIYKQCAARAKCGPRSGCGFAECVALQGFAHASVRWAQELAACQHTLIGDETLGIKGISGGERRRVGVGLQV